MPANGPLCARRDLARSSALSPLVSRASVARHRSRACPRSAR